MNNLLSYCGLVDAKIRASDKDLPVPTNEKEMWKIHDKQPKDFYLSLSGAILTRLHFAKLW